MSYIRAKLAEIDDLKDRRAVVVSNLEEPDIDFNLDDEMLRFVLALIAKVDGLGEGEALVVWKDIF